MSSSPLEWSAEEVRRLGYAVVDAIADRQAGLRDGPPWDGATRAEMHPLLDEPCPENPSPVEQVMERALRDVLPKAGRIDHPRFFAFVPSSPAWPSIMGEWLASGFNIFQGTWLESAGPSQIELTVLDWFREWLSMPEGASGLFTSGGSAANLIAVVAARDWAGFSPRSVAYIGEQSHSSVERALRIAGFAADQIRRIPGGADYRMDPAAAADVIRADRAAGLEPVLLAANGGATNTGAVDPLGALADLAERENLWFHVDAAYGGFAVLTEVGREQLAGIERARSVTLDPHKWLFQSYEVGCLMVRNPDDLTRAFRVMPEYLQDTDLGLEQVNFADRGLQLTRAFRALKVWMTIQTHGRAQIAHEVQCGIDRGRYAEARIVESAELELMSEATLGIVCFRALPPQAALDAIAALSEEEQIRLIDSWNNRIQDAVVTEGVAMMSSTRLGEIRVADVPDELPVDGGGSGRYPPSHQEPLTRDSAAVTHGSDASNNREAVLLTRVGLGLMPLVIAGFALRFDLPIADAIFTSVLLLMLPVLALSQLLQSGSFIPDRLSAYASSASTILVLASIALVLGAIGPGLPALGLSRPDPATAGAMLGLMAFGSLTIMGFFHLTGVRLGWTETSLTEGLIPRNVHERKMFILLSFVAGLGEEVVYRGYLMAILVPLMASPWLAAAVASLAFALLHGYQGSMGVIRTGMMGMLFASSLVVGGTLWPAIVCHILVNLVGGLWLGPRVLKDRN